MRLSVDPGPSAVCDSMTASGGALRSHWTALTHAVTTHPTPITPHHVINAIATPIGPSPFQPLSNGGKAIRAASGMMVPSITVPASPASARYDAQTDERGQVAQPQRAGDQHRGAELGDERRTAPNRVAISRCFPWASVSPSRPARPSRRRGRPC